MEFENIQIKSLKDLGKFMFEWEDNIKKEIMQNGNKGKIDYKLLWKELQNKLLNGQK